MRTFDIMGELSPRAKCGITFDDYWFLFAEG
jgi:hypothetical protein